MELIKKKNIRSFSGNGYYTEIISHFMKKTGNYYVTEYKFPPVEAVNKGQKNLSTLKKILKNLVMLILYFF